MNRPSSPRHDTPARPGRSFRGLLALALFLPLPLLLGCPFKAEEFIRHCTQDKECADGNPCTEDKCTCTDDKCSDGTCDNPPKTAHVGCGAGSASVCDGEGNCVECLSSVDCAANHPQKPICDTKQQKCVSCDDGVKNGKEIDVDCGGPDCGACLGQPCDPQNGCGNHTFCANQDQICCSTTCTDKCEACAKAKTGQPDGMCAPIPFGMDPDMECTTLGSCGATPGKCRCEDGVKNGDESDVDCGGAVCSGCGGGKTCGSTTDCAVEVPGETPACLDGACCESICHQQCHGCDATGKCASVPAGASDPNMTCQSNQACGAGTSGCVGKAAASCNPALSGGDCLSGVCTSPAKTCAQSAPGKPCNSTSDCKSGTCQSYICM